LRIRTTTILALTLLLLLQHPYTALAQAENVKPNLSVGLHVLVVVFDPSGRIMRGLANETVAYTLDCMGLHVTLQANITYIAAPRWALEELKEFMSQHYRSLGIPSWAEGYAKARNLTICWLELRPFYEVLWSIVRGIIVRDYHRVPNDVVAVIGDVDGVSRQYYEEPLSPIRTGRLEGVRGWAGEHPLAFYDLTVIPKPWPSNMVPFHSLGVPVDLEHEPPIWSLSDPSEYVRRLVLDHIRFHYLTICPFTPWYARVFRVHIVLVDYGNETVTGTVREMLNATLVAELIRMMDPWVNVTVDVQTVKPAPGSPLAEILEHAREENGWLVLYFRDVARLIGEDAYKRFVTATPCGSTPSSSACDFAFYILATPKPSYMRFRDSGMNFTGFGGGWLGATSYPGYGYRVLRGTLSRVVAHEAGHVIGLLHPFQLYNNTIRWLMDFIETPMSYYDEGLAYYRPGDISPYESFKTALIHIAALLASKHMAEPPEPVVQALAEGRPDIALNMLARLLAGAPTGTPTAAVTATPRPVPAPTLTYTVTEPTLPPPATVTVTRTRLVTVTMPVAKVVMVTETKTVHHTLRETATVTYTVTSTAIRTVTETVTLTASSTREAPGTAKLARGLELATLLLAGVALGYLAAVAGRKR
jgi:hypothetical protein